MCSCAAGPCQCGQCLANLKLDLHCDTTRIQTSIVYVIYTAQNRPVLQYGMCTDCTRIIQSVAENTAGFP